ncbi:hypothetical protein Trydic_g10031 [Trypoxylus dichotomus]
MNSAAKTVVRKPKASGKPNTPAATTGHKPTPKKLESPNPGKRVMNRRPRKPQFLQIAFWKANGLTTKKTELEEFVQRHQLDADHIGKTHLTASNRLTLPNFRVYRSNREDPRGRDTAILVKSTIEHHADLVLDLINIVATAVTVNLATGPVKLVAAYKVPRHPGSGYRRRRPQRQAPIMELQEAERKRHLSTPLR